MNRGKAYFSTHENMHHRTLETDVRDWETRIAGLEKMANETRLMRIGLGVWKMNCKLSLVAQLRIYRSEYFRILERQFEGM